MSWFGAAIYDPLMARTEEACLSAWRKALLADVTGDVLELGAGTGANLRHYDASKLERLVLAEPDPDMRARLCDKTRRSELKAEIVAAPAERIPLGDASVDWVVATLVFCSVRLPEQALREVVRVLRPGGKLAFLEHVIAEEGTNRRRWQRRLAPCWRCFTDNCNIDRDTESAIRQAGFSIATIERQSMRKALPIVRPTIRGVAVKA